MSIEDDIESGWDWFHSVSAQLKSPLQKLVGLYLADHTNDGTSNGFLRRGTCCTAYGAIDDVAEFAGASLEETAVAVLQVAAATGCYAAIGTNDKYEREWRFSFEVPQYSAEAVELARKERAAQLRMQMEDVRKKLVSLGFLNEPCRACGEKSEHIDHILPLSRGGDNALTNLQPLCASCNLSKHDKTMEEFMAVRAAAAVVIREDGEAGHA